MKNTSEAEPQKKKAKGPIRTGAVVPAVVLTLILGVFFKFFFDGAVRRALQYVGTQVNGAEVDVGFVHSSFLHAAIAIGNIQVTDKNHPERNIVQVGEIRFKMLWDALLRGKVVINDASILNIQALEPRRHPGYVVPPPPPSRKSTSTLERVQKQVLQQAEKQYNKNFLGDVASVLGGTNPADQLKNIEGQLKSEQQIQELQKELKQKQVEWQARIKQLPQGKDIKQYSDQIKALKFDLKNPVQFAQNVNKANEIIKAAQAKLKAVQDASRDLNGDLGHYSQAFNGLDKLVNQDMRDLQTRLKLPNIDAKEFSQQLFMSMIAQKITGIRKYVAVARHYMPAPKTKAEKQVAKAEQLVPPKRGQGRTFRFPITTGYPLFWLKHAEISSRADSSPYSGDISGEIRDLSTSPEFIKHPTVITVKGDFPKQNIHGLDAKITLDHTTAQAKESMLIKIASFPVSPLAFSNSPDVKLALTGADGSTATEGTLVGDQMNLTMKNEFRNAKYDLQTKNPTVHEIVQNVLNGIPLITVNADVTGSFDAFNLHINSNLGDELSKGFQKQLQAKIEQAKAQLKKLIDDRIGGERAKLKTELDQVTGGISKSLKSRQAEVDKSIHQAQSQLASKQGHGSGKNLEEEGKKLLKGFGF